MKSVSKCQIKDFHSMKRLFIKLRYFAIFRAT